jgi:S-adenosyl methyltransferase
MHRPSVWSPRAAAVAAGVVPPGSRIVYTDNDLMVLIHAKALLTSVREDRDQLG